MNRVFVATFVVLGLIPNLAPAVEIVNIRLCYGLFPESVGGATRKSAEFLPGDGIVLTYDIAGLMKDAKGRFDYETKFQVFDANDKSVLGPDSREVTPVPLLGGDAMPGHLVLALPAKQAPGKYSVTLTVSDRVAKKASTVTYRYTVLPEGFGLIHVVAPSVHLPGQHHVLQFALVNMTLNKEQKPSAEVTVRILDDKTKEKVTDVSMVLPRDMAADTDLGKQNIVPLQYPVYLNRTGRFIVEVTAVDKLGGNKKVELRYPFTVIDVSTFTGK